MECSGTAAESRIDEDRAIGKFLTHAENYKSLHHASFHPNLPAEQKLKRSVPRLRRADPSNRRASIILGLALKNAVFIEKFVHHERRQNCSRDNRL